MLAPQLKRTAQAIADARRKIFMIRAAYGLAGRKSAEIFY
jgi:hypothetical protein